MRPYQPLRLTLPLLVLALAGCATTAPRARPMPASASAAPSLELRPTPQSFAPMPPAIQRAAGARPADVQVGTRGLIDTAAARALPSATPAANGSIIFNFNDQPIAGVVQILLGKVLKRSYSIAPGVHGHITFATAAPVTSKQALPILEMLLSWTGNTLVEQNGTFVITPANGASAGVLVPSLLAPTPSNGAQAELFPLHYIAAAEMAKLLAPFARPHAVLLVDPQHNLLVVQGTPEELVNYARTIRIFDVDWFKGMSVGVYALRHAQVKTLLPELQSAFGAKSNTPMAGMLHFLPIERTNAIVVITPQPAYLTEIHRWIRRMDRAANSATLHVYQVQNIKATSLAEDLSSLYGSTNGTSAPSGQVAPGLQPVQLGSPMGASTGYGTTGTGQGVGSSGVGLNSAQGLNPLSTPARVSVSTANGIHITAIRDSNQLLVRCSEGQWQDLLPAIQSLDVAPLEVEIQTRILEVELTGNLQYGVQWYLGGLIGTQPGSPPNTSQLGRKHSAALGFGGAAYNAASDALYYSFVSHNVQGIVQALESNGNTRVLSAPTLVVLNNHEASITVGDKIPVIQNYISGGLLPTTGTTSTSGALSVGEVQYIDTGIMLDVRPRVNPGGRVYLDLDQIVSQPGTQDAVGNYTILNRQLTTSVALRDGETLLLGGLIQQNTAQTDNGVPLLSDIPVLGKLFGSTNNTRARTELILLITPHVIPNRARARAITREYEEDLQHLGTANAFGTRPPSPPPA